MSELEIESGVAVASSLRECSSSANGIKRRQSEGAEQESKRQRVSPGKSSPAADAEEEQRPQERGTPPDSKNSDSLDRVREGKRKSIVIDEKKRTKRLFGALLGNLNQPSDRALKRRLKIEERRKAELQRQDDERREDTQRRLEKLAEQRRRNQVKVDEENMHMRHQHLLNAANFLQTNTEPKLYYRPWDLRADEEDRIDLQIKEARATVERECAEFRNTHDDHQMIDEPQDGGIAATKTICNEIDEDLGNSDASARDRQISVSKSPERVEQFPSNPEDSVDDVRPRNVPESSVVVANSGHKANSSGDQAASDPAGKHHDMDEDGDHVVEGDEDTVIY
ncbi:MAG: hypothetical protein FE78DRAFT_86557 [Acidomyces sp. 'richmondensis']|nr:MAG: hypothetical protein FE78DRAFT_86557 [Acidomyces sp. 'richmondensis']